MSLSEMKNKKLVVGITAPQSIILLKGQLKYLSDKGFDVYLLATETNDTIEFCKKEDATLLPVDIEREISLWSDLMSLVQIIRIYLKVKPDIINMGTPKVSLLGLLAAVMCRVPRRIYTCRGFRFEHEKGILRFILLMSEKVASLCADKVIAISDSVRELGIQEKIFSEEKSLVIHKGSSNGVEFEAFDSEKYSDKEVEKFKKDLKIGNEFVFGYVGRIVERKGFSELINAFSEIYDEDKSVKMVVCGRPYYDQIDKAVMEKAESHPGIIMTGLVPYEDVPLYMLTFDTFVLPAYWEGFGNVLIQAAAMGVPVISTNVTGCKDAVSDGYNGELVPSKDVPSLVRVMKKFREDPTLRKKYGENGIAWSKNFEGELIWEEMASLF